jgi:hypothetical protein
MLEVDRKITPHPPLTPYAGGRSKNNPAWGAIRGNTVLKIFLNLKKKDLRICRHVRFQRIRKEQMDEMINNKKYQNKIQQKQQYHQQIVQLQRQKQFIKQSIEKTTIEGKIRENQQQKIECKKFSIEWYFLILKKKGKIIILKK